MKQNVNSTIFVNVPIASPDGIDVTADPVWLAFTPAGEPVSDADWKVASWGMLNGEVVARVLVGPAGDVTLDVGWYDVRARLTDTLERPWLDSGQLLVHT